MEHHEIYEIGAHAFVVATHDALLRGLNSDQAQAVAQAACDREMAEWRDEAYKRYGGYKQQLQTLKDQLQSTPGSALLLLSISHVEEELAYWEPIIESMPSDLTS